MKSVARFSASVAFAALLCFAPFAFGQDTLNLRTDAGNGVLNYAPSAFLTFAVGHGVHQRPGNFGNGGNGGGNNGWGNGGNGGGWGNGGGGWGNGGNGGGNGGGGTQVPEGGTTLMYLSLAGLCCFGAVVFRARRQSSVPETK